MSLKAPILKYGLLKEISILFRYDYHKLIKETEVIIAQEKTRQKESGLDDVYAKFPQLKSVLESKHWLRVMFGKINGLSADGLGNVNIEIAPSTTLIRITIGDGSRKTFRVEFYASLIEKLFIEDRHAIFILGGASAKGTFVQLSSGF
jgi:hypothetical protein